MKPVDRLSKLETAVNALTLRERLMLFAGALIVAGGLWEALLAGPLEAREAQASSEVSATQQRLEQLDQSMELAAHGIGDGMSGQSERLETLRRSVAEAEETIRLFTSDLVGPAEMRHVLERLIAEQQGLTLIRASNLDVEPLIERDAADAGAPEEPMLYRHGLRLEVEGRYLDALAYLEAVEQLPWRLYWGNLSLVSREYPLNRIVIELYTLSLDEEWIGV